MPLMSLDKLSYIIRHSSHRNGSPFSRQESACFVNRYRPEGVWKARIIAVAQIDCRVAAPADGGHMATTAPRRSTASSATSWSTPSAPVCKIQMTEPSSCSVIHVPLLSFAPREACVRRFLYDQTRPSRGRAVSAQRLSSGGKRNV
jgi:hypothetical protein